MSEFLQHIFTHCSIVALIFAVGGEFCNATSIVGFWTKTQVVIAADGLREHENATGRVTRQFLGCKIYADSHGVFFASAGVSPNIKGKELSVPSLLREANFTGNNKAEQVRDAMKELHATITAVWSDVHKSDSLFFASSIQGHATQVIFGWRNGGKVGAASYSAVPLPDGSSTPPQFSLYPQPGTSPNGPAWMVGGSNSELIKSLLNAMKQNGESLPADVPEFARRLIKLEIDGDIARHPDGKSRSVGWPIDVLAIDRSDGPHWYRRQPESQCPDLP
jgi:hypothetical protein